MKETETKKKASFVETRENGKSVQKECLVDLQTGKVEVGQVRLAGLKVDESSPVASVRVEFRGTEFTVDSNKTEKGMAYSIKDSEMGGFTMLTYKAKTLAEQKEENINPRWKPKFNS